MKTDELLILDALNIASTAYAVAPPPGRRPEAIRRGINTDRDWWTTAESVARVIREDERIARDWQCLADGWDTIRVAYTLRAMRAGYPFRSESLVERLHRPGRAGLWRMSVHGLKALCS